MFTNTADSETPEPLDGAPAAHDRRPHAVVIGSGFGGLAAAVRLGARGYRVTVLEKLDKPGGRAYVFEQDGFVFDAGPTIVTAPFLFEELWEMCGRRMADDVELRPVDPFYRMRFSDGTTFDYNGDPETMRRRVAELSPDDVEGYERYMEASREIFRIGFQELGHVHFGSILDMARVAPDLIRLRGDRSVYGTVARYVKDERLRIMLSFHPLLIGGNPFRASSVYCLISYLERHWGVHFAMGGTGALAKGLARLIEGQGNRIRYQAQVQEIEVENGRAAGVRLTTGERIPAEIVVSNADSAYTYRHLLPARARKRWTDRKLDRSRYSMSLFVWYFGTRRRYEDTAHHTILLGPRYKELIEDIFERKILAEDFSLYLHRPTATDPSLAPEGCDTFYVLSPVPHLDAGIDWSEMGPVYRDRIADFLERTELPDLRNQIVSERMITPQDFQDRLLSVRGAAFGLEPRLMQSAWFRPHNKSEDVEGLYLVGAGTHPGAGLPGVLSSARVLDKVVPDAAELV
jgi:phytoene desaturase